MKISDSHYDLMKKEIDKIWTKEKHDAHLKFVLNEGKAKDVEKRVRWDWMYYAKLTPFVCENLYQYANDKHIDTALRNIILNLNINRA
tara:strand:+ start:305 stop:568 length:264 start_codon:yes stop_codon:yes gene_type:complete